LIKIIFGKKTKKEIKKNKKGEITVGKTKKREN
jgi:hypothetical protein